MVNFKIPKLFGKKGEDAPPDIEQGNDESEDAPENKEEVPEQPVSEPRTMIELERLKAQMESLNETKDNWSQRFSDISERIGELRSLVAESDSKMVEIEVKATKAVDLVEELDPQKLLGELQRRDAQYESLKAKLEGSQAIYDSIINDMKDLHSKINLFRGVEGLVKLSDEVREELISIQKIKAVTETHADKVENIFLDIRNSSMNFAKLSNSVKEMEGAMTETRKLVDAQNVRIRSFADKSETAELSAKLGSLTEKMNDYAEKISKTSFETEQFLGVVESDKQAIQQLKDSQEMLRRYLEKHGSSDSLASKNSERINEILEILEILTEKVLTEDHGEIMKKMKKKAEEDALGVVKKDRKEILGFYLKGKHDKAKNAEKNESEKLRQQEKTGEAKMGSEKHGKTRRKENAEAGTFLQKDSSQQM